MAAKNEHHERSPSAGTDQPPASDADGDGHVELSRRREPLVHDPWSSLRKFTSARIALGRAGASVPTAELLSFSLDHAEARDAVNSELDLASLERSLAPLGLPIVTLATQAPDRSAYLQRPDLGRALSEQSRADLAELQPGGPFDVVLIVADGLSALAAQLQAPAVLASLVPELLSKNLRLAPLVLVTYGRVAVMDSIGAALNARLGLILIGERPGLGTADSLGAYLEYNPSPGKTDADRNCVSNIRPAGLPPIRAARTLAYLIEQILRKQISGVSVKDEREVKQQLP